MSAVMPRAVAALEALTAQPRGLLLGDVSEAIDAPKSATHRVLTELVDLGYVTQDGADGRYRLGLRMVSQALRHLAAIPLVELARPLLDDLAEASGELARLGIPEHGTLVWVAKAQGARAGLRYDPDDGRQVKLARTATGMAWLSTLPPGEVERCLELQGFDDMGDYGPNGPSDIAEAIQAVDGVRRDGYCCTDSTFELGTATVAVPVREPGSPARAVLSITGPSVRLTHERALGLLPALREAAEQLVHLAVDPTP